jgi:hypothetical protein
VRIISVDSASLVWLGAESERLAGASLSGAPTVSGGFAATSAAVRTLHSDVEEAGERIAGRLRSTGDTVSRAAHGFAGTETINEDLLY